MNILNMIPAMGLQTAAGWMRVVFFLGLITYFITVLLSHENQKSRLWHLLLDLCLAATFFGGGYQLADASTPFLQYSHPGTDNFSAGLVIWDASGILVIMSSIKILGIFFYFPDYWNKSPH